MSVQAVQALPSCMGIIGPETLGDKQCDSHCETVHGVGGRICCLQEMYYRHLYATVQPTLEQRCESWDNYCALFNIILTSSINMQVGCQTSPLFF